MTWRVWYEAYWGTLPGVQSCWSQMWETTTPLLHALLRTAQQWELHPELGSRFRRAKMWVRSDKAAKAVEGNSWVRLKDRRRPKGLTNKTPFKYLEVLERIHFLWMAWIGRIRINNNTLGLSRKELTENQSCPQEVVNCPSLAEMLWKGYKYWTDGWTSSYNLKLKAQEPVFSTQI